MEKKSNTQGKGNHAKLWTGPFLKIMSINSCTTLCNSMLMQVLPLYVIYLGSSNAVAGALTGVFTISALLFRPLFGNLVDAKGRKTILLIGIGIYFITSVGYSLTSAVILILMIRSLQGVGNSAFSTTAGTVVADVLPQSRLSEGIGYYGVSFNIVTSFGPALMLFLRNSFGYSSVFYAAAAISLVAFGLGSTMNYEKNNLGEANANESPVIKERKKISLKTAFEKTSMPGALVLVLSMCPAGLTNTFLVRYSETLGITGIGLYFTINAFSMLLSRLFVGRFCDKYGAHRILPPGLILIFLGVLTISLARSLPMFLLAAPMMGMGFGMVNPTVQAYVVRNAPLNRRGAASATYYSAIDIGNGVGSMLGGFLTQMIGFAATWAFYLIFVAGAMVMFFFVLRKKILKERACADTFIV